jgi:transcriptional regulator with XRE-family HTH domain
MVDKADQIQQRFGKNVRRLRHAAGLSQEELALRSGLDRSFVGQVERGERNISLTNIYRLAAGLKIDPSLLFERPQK